MGEQWISSRESQSLLRSSHEGRLENPLAQKADRGEDQPREVHSAEPGPEGTSRLGMADQSAKGRLQPRLQPNHRWSERMRVDSSDPWHRCGVLVGDEISRALLGFEAVVTFVYTRRSTKGAVLGFASSCLSGRPFHLSQLPVPPMI